MRRLLMVLGCMASSAQACLNTYEENLLEMMYRDDRTALQSTVQRLEAGHAAGATPESSNDLAVGHILLRNHAAAIALLTALEKEHPGLSRTASNLGTALELAGRNDEALHWIKAGIARDPADHEGTEWLHVKILEAKIALAKDAAWLQTHHVLGIDFGKGARPALPAALPVDHAGTVRTFAVTEKAIDYQMQERLRFVTPPDPLVGDIYFTRADIASLRKEEVAAPFNYYLAAKFFQAPDQALVALRARQYVEDSGVPDGNHDFTDGPVTTALRYGLWLPGGGILLLVYRRWRRRQKDSINEEKETA